MIHGTKRWIGMCAMLALIATGCHKPTYDHLQPTAVKWSLAVVAQAESQAQQAEVQKLGEGIANAHAMPVQFSWAAPADAGKTSAQYAEKGIDLVLLTNGADLGDLPQKNLRTRFVVVGDSAQPNSVNVRHLVPDQNRLYFLAGYLAAEANKESSEPYSVLVDDALPNSDPRWQMIVAGTHYAGRRDLPVQINASALVAEAPKSVTDVKQPKLSGQSLILLTSLTDQAWTKVRAKGMDLIRTDGRTAPLPQQASVLAQPKTLLADALKEESDLLVSGKWQGQQVATLPAKHLYGVVNPQLVSDQALASRLELIEDGLAAGSIKPNDFLNAPVQMKR